MADNNNVKVTNEQEIKQPIRKFKVLSPALTVLEKTEQVLAKKKKSLSKDQELEDVYPMAWVQGEWANNIVEKGDVLDTENFEAQRLLVLLSQGCLEEITNNK
jgi:hypothetical protein